mgnify:CR=1 FL=1|tara:strand:+ start:1446 stop:1736 length:291 start_codon:yes stop_codon:yes gene_type:complete
MTKEIKLEDKEIKEIRELRESITRLSFDFGRIKIDIINAESRLDSLMKLQDDKTNEYRGKLRSEEKIVEKLNKKYGKGQVDITNGIFVSMEEDGKS